MWNVYAPDPGLCGSCEHVRIIESRRGSRFFLCRMAEVDPRFAKYPRLPVLRCIGYAPTDVPRVEEERGSGAPQEETITTDERRTP
jgi:hypothetical protein